MVKNKKPNKKYVSIYIECRECQERECAGCVYAKDKIKVMQEVKRK